MGAPPYRLRQVNEPDVLSIAYENQIKALEIRALEINIEKKKQSIVFNSVKLLLKCN
jgi:hypothetical protein